MNAVACFSLADHIKAHKRTGASIVNPMRQQIEVSNRTTIDLQAHNTDVA